MARRDEIVAVATRCFARAGFEGSSILEIAAEVGISRAGLLHHFGSKEHLLMAVLDERERADREVFIESGSRSAGGLGVLRGMLRLAQLNEERPGLVKLFVVLGAEATDNSHPAHVYFRAHYQRILDGTAAALRSASVYGYLRSGVEPESFAKHLVALQDGLQVQWLLHPDRVHIATELELVIRAVLTKEAGHLL